MSGRISRLLRVVAAGAALVWVIALAFSAPVTAAPPDAADLEAEIVCPVCRTTLDMSNAEVAQRMKAYIRERIADGATEKQIKAELVDQFGPGVLAEPPKKGFDLLAWMLPIGGAAVGALGLGGLAVAWSRRGRRDVADPEAVIDRDLERRVDEALAEFDD